MLVGIGVLVESVVVVGIRLLDAPIVVTTLAANVEYTNMPLHKSFRFLVPFMNVTPPYSHKFPRLKS